MRILESNMQCKHHSMAQMLWEAILKLSHQICAIALHCIASHCIITQPKMRSSPPALFMPSLAHCFPV